MNEPSRGVVATPLTGRRFGIALALTLAAVAAIWIRTPPLYFTNDDVLIRLGIEGQLVPGAPATGFVLFTHSALAWALVWLHAHTALPLWDLVTIGTLTVGIATIVALGWCAAGGGWLPGSIAVAALAIPALPLLGGVQFTISAVAAGGGAAALGFVELAGRRPRRSMIVAAVLLGLLGEMIRPMGASAGGLAVGVLLVPVAISAPAPLRRQYLLALATVLAGVAVVTTGLQYIDGLIYRLDPAWDEYQRYHWRLVHLLEWGGGTTLAEADAMRHAAGWTVNDWVLLKRWLGVDPALHGVEQIARVMEAAPNAAWGGTLLTRLTQVFDAEHLRRLVAESASVLGIAAVYAIVRGRGRENIPLAGATVAFVLFCLVLEVVFKDLPFRLLAPLQLCFAAVVVMTGGAGRAPAGWQPALGLVLLLALGGRELATVVTRLEGSGRQAAQVDEEVRLLSRLDPSLLVLHADGFPAEIFWRPLVRRTDAPPNIRLDDNNQSPHLQRFLTATGRQPLLRAICQDPSILIISEDDRIEPVVPYMREHFAADVQWTKVFDASFRAWRCTPRNAPGESDPVVRGRELKDR